MKYSVTVIPKEEPESPMTGSGDTIAAAIVELDNHSMLNQNVKISQHFRFYNVLAEALESEHFTSDYFDFSDPEGGFDIQVGSNPRSLLEDDSFFRE